MYSTTLAHHSSFLSPSASLLFPIWRGREAGSGPLASEEEELLVDCLGLPVRFLLLPAKRTSRRCAEDPCIGSARAAVSWIRQHWVGLNQLSKAV